MYRSSSPNTGSNPGGDRIPKKKKERLTSEKERSNKKGRKKEILKGKKKVRIFK